jgi:hypothetical protein
MKLVKVLDSAGPQPNYEGCLDIRYYHALFFGTIKKGMCA